MYKILNLHKTKVFSYALILVILLSCMFLHGCDKNNTSEPEKVLKYENCLIKEFSFDFKKEKTENMEHGKQILEKEKVNNEARFGTAEKSEILNHFPGNYSLAMLFDKENEIYKELSYGYTGQVTDINFTNDEIEVKYFFHSAKELTQTDIKNITEDVQLVFGDLENETEFEKMLKNKAKKAEEQNEEDIVSNFKTVFGATIKITKTSDEDKTIKIEGNYTVKK